MMLRIPRRTRIALTLLLFVAALVAWGWFSGGFERYWYQRGRGGDMAYVVSTRQALYLTIAAACRDFHQQHGRYPASLAELDSSAATNFATVRLEYAIDRTLSVDFSALLKHELAIVVDDPGIDWPGYPARQGQTAPELQQFRFVLANDFQIYRRSEVAK